MQATSHIVQRKGEQAKEGWMSRQPINERAVPLARQHCILCKGEQAKEGCSGSPSVKEQAKEGLSRLSHTPHCVVGKRKCLILIQIGFCSEAAKRAETWGLCTQAPLLCICLQPVGK
eukprot:1133400-Pelagomonas_calceolata.AAC.5